MAHNHHHDSGKNLKLAFLLNFGFTIFEVIGGFYTNSMAILSDAIHDLGDTLSLGTAWLLDKKSKQKPDASFSFGYARFSLLGALINGVVLVVGSVFVIVEAAKRISHPEMANADGMMLFALVGVAVNGYAAWKMSHGKTLNEKVVSWHLIEDVLGWCVVLVASIVLKIKYLLLLDPILSLFITAYILWNALKRLKETLFTFLQGIPKEIDLVKIEKEILSIHHVQSLHDTHLWSLEGEHHVFSTHLRLENIDSVSQIIQTKKEIKVVLAKYHLKNCTIETELDDESCSMVN
ncbi:MAG: cation transporter [Flavobacteriales bacterium]|nr:cation transporter [Flavobacteriales bacterium]